MKMICPHCGVKGSADDALLGRKVQCPKCTEVFEVGAEVVEAIEVGELELEQLSEQADEQFDMASEEEIDDVFSKLLAGDTGESAAEDAQDDFDSLLDDGEEAEQDDVVAALSSLEDESDAENELIDEDQQDETLTIIEDFPEGTMLDEGDDQFQEDPGEEELSAALNGIDDEELYEEDTLEAKETEDIEEDEERLDFEEGFLDDETDEQQTSPPEDEIDDDDDLPDELFDEEPPVETSAADDTENVDEELSGADSSADEEEISFDSEEMSDENENILSASFLDEQLEQDEDESAETPDVQKCSACDQYVDAENKYESGGNVYCSKCVPTDVEPPKGDEELNGDGESAFPGLSQGAEENEAGNGEARSDGAVGRFTVTTLIKDAWYYSKGVKGSIWAGLAVTYVVLFCVAFVSFFFNMKVLSGLESMSAMLVESGIQILISFFSFIFWAGVLMIAVNRVGQQYFSWKMVFSPFKRFGAMVVLAILQTIMLTIGFCLFIIPGIYLSVGYILAIPLVFIQGLSPWQALETSRQVVHKRWWTVFFALIVMSLIVSLSAVLLGVGLIWTVPMFTVMIGVLFYHLCGEDEAEEAFE